MLYDVSSISCLSPPNLAVSFQRDCGIIPTRLRYQTNETPVSQYRSNETAVSNQRDPSITVSFRRDRSIKDRWHQDFRPDFSEDGRMSHSNCLKNLCKRQLAVPLKSFLRLSR